MKTLKEDMFLVIRSKTLTPTETLSQSDVSEFLEKQASKGQMIDKIDDGTGPLFRVIGSGSLYVEEHLIENMKVKEEVKPIKTGVLDLDDNEIELGDTIGFLYVNPMGETEDDIDSEEVYEVVWKYGAFGVNKTLLFVSLSEMVRYSSGEYVSNAGNIIIQESKVNARILSKNKESK